MIRTSVEIEESDVPIIERLAVKSGLSRSKYLAQVISSAASEGLYFEPQYLSKWESRAETPSPSNPSANRRNS